MQSNLFLPEIRELIAARDLAALRDVLEDWTSPDIAEFMEELDGGEQLFLFLCLPRDAAAKVFEHVELEIQEELILGLAQERLAEILNEMSPDDRTDLLVDVPAGMTRRLISLLSPEERKVAQNLLGYPEESIGRLMTPDYLTLNPQWTVAKALEHIRVHGQDSETLNVLYVTDGQGKLLDDISMRSMVLSEPDTVIADLMDHNAVSLNAVDDQEEAVASFKKYDRFALPVTNSSGDLLGIVTVDDVLDVAEEEATEDFQKMGAMNALDEPYMNVGIWEMVRSRVGWLVLLTFGGMVTAMALSLFAEALEKAIVLALFTPLIISSGGNSGSQAATLIIRALSLGEVTLSDWWRIMGREILTGLCLGLALGVVGFGRIAWGGLVSNEYGAAWPWLGLTVAFSLVLVVVWGSLIGSMLPLILQRLGADPATSSTPFVATLADVMGILIYFSTAMVLLSGSLI